MAWYAPSSFRAQVLIIVIASVAMAVLAVILVQDAWNSTRQTLAEEAQQQCATAVRELQSQFADRASLLDASAEVLLFEAQDLSLRGLSAAVLRSYEDTQGGFLLGPARRMAGQAGPFSASATQSLNDVERRLVLDLANRSSYETGVVAGNTEEGTDLIVAAATAIEDEDAVAWTLRRLAGANDPAAQSRRWWLAGLVLSAVLGLGAIISISISLRQGVDTLNKGLAQLESDFGYRLPPVGGDFGKVAQAINRMADRRGALETTLRRQDRLAALGRVVAGVAHEIRNPLNSLLLTLELLERRIRKGSLSGDEVQEAIHEVDRLERILTRLLAFGRPDLEKRQIQHLQPLIERATRIVQSQAQSKHVEITVPAAALDQIEIDADALAIEQVLINLLLNAIDASPNRGTISVATAAERHQLRIAIHDEGPGIPHSIRDYLFDPYFTTKENGTGLGLAVSREIVRHHGGTLEFESSEQGTTFVLILPTTRDST